MLICFRVKLDIYNMDVLEMPEKKDDHYVSQTYLKWFIDPNKPANNKDVPGLLNVYNKKFPKKSKYKTPRQVCYEVNGDRNSYFPNNPRILDDFLTIIEPKWELTISELAQGIFSSKTKLIISLYVAYLRGCNPTAKRLGKALLDIDLVDRRRVAAKYVKEQMDGCEDNIRLIEDLLSPEVVLGIKPECPHALAIKNLVLSGICYFTLPWAIVNNTSSYPFLTSDNPATLIYYPGRNYAETLFLPLTPKLAISIFSDDSGYGSQQLLKVSADAESVEKTNIELIKSAENIIISNVQADWISSLIEKHKNWKMDISNVKVSSNINESIYHVRQYAREK